VVTAPASRFSFDRRALVRGLRKSDSAASCGLTWPFPPATSGTDSVALLSLVATAVRGPSRVSRPPAAPALKV
jgi:hypothetical protein